MTADIAAAPAASTTTAKDQTGRENTLLRATFEKPVELPRLLEKINTLLRAAPGG